VPSTGVTCPPSWPLSIHSPWIKFRIRSEVNASGATRRARSKVGHRATVRQRCRGATGGGAGHGAQLGSSVRAAPAGSQPGGASSVHRGGPGLPGPDADAGRRWRHPGRRRGRGIGRKVRGEVGGWGGGPGRAGPRSAGHPGPQGQHQVRRSSRPGAGGAGCISAGPGTGAGGGPARRRGDRQDSGRPPAGRWRHHHLGRGAATGVGGRGRQVGTHRRGDLRRTCAHRGHDRRAARPPRPPAATGRGPPGIAGLLRRRPSRAATARRRRRAGRAPRAHLAPRRPGAGAGTGVIGQAHPRHRHLPVRCRRSAPRRPRECSRWLS